MVVNIRRMAHVCNNNFLIIFLRRDTIAFWKMSLLHWLTKLTHQTLYREKIIGEVLWRQWCHGDWTLKTVSEVAFCFIIATGFKRIVIRTWFTEAILVPIIIVSTSISIIVVAVFITLCSFVFYFCNCVGVLLVIIGVGLIVAAILIFVALLLLLHHCFVLFLTLIRYYHVFNVTTAIFVSLSFLLFYGCCFFVFVVVVVVSNVIIITYPFLLL